MNYLTKKQGEACFERIANDPRFLNAIISGYCHFRRELILIELLDLGVNPSHLGRVYAIAGGGMVLFPDHEYILDENMAGVPAYQSNDPIKQTAFDWHTAVRIDLWDEHREEVVRRIVDPALDPLTMMTESQWQNMIQARAEKTVNEFFFLASPLGELPVIDPNISPLACKIHHNLVEAGKEPARQPTEILLSGVFQFPIPFSDYDRLASRRSSKSHMEYLLRNVSRELANGEEVDTLKRELEGKGFVDRYRQFINWSKSPSI